jgi:glycosyltransferase involved in cell wall biosynthesis
VADGVLRLALDVTAVPVDPVGAGRYTLELAAALSDRSDIDMTVVARRSDATRWGSGAPGARVEAVAPGPRPLRLAWEQVRLPSLLSGLPVDVHHAPHYTMPERSAVPSVVTVHDMSFFEEAGWHQRSKVILFRRAIRVAARRAAAVVCPSRVTAEQLARWCRVQAEVFVAPHGVDPVLFSAHEPAPGADAAALARVDPRLGDGSPFLVFVGTLEPRKDVPTLVGAFARIAGRHPEARLVLAGGSGWGAAAVDRAVEASGLGDRIIRTGYVPEEAVPALLRASAAAVYPALYEGFGLPALEALACGTPLVTTAGTAMEEVAGEAALLVAPGAVDDLADALDAVLARPSGGDAAAERRQRGFAVVARHTWAASAARHMEAYRFAARGTAVLGMLPRPTSQ